MKDLPTSRLSRYSPMFSYKCLLVLAFFSFLNIYLRGGESAHRGSGTGKESQADTLLNMEPNTGHDTGLDLMILISRPESKIKSWTLKSLGHPAALVLVFIIRFIIYPKLRCVLRIREGSRSILFLPEYRAELFIKKTSLSPT